MSDYVFYEDEEIECENCGDDYTWRGGQIKHMDGEVPSVCGWCYHNPEYSPIELICQNVDCDNEFTWTAKNQKFYADKGYSQPELCPDCVTEKRNTEDEDVECEQCGYEFTIPARAIVRYRREEGEWETPTLCRKCESRPDLEPEMLTCQNASCGQEFEWTVGEQIFYESKGLEPPALCKDCRDTNKAMQEEHITCSLCGFERNISKKYIISYLRNEGEWKLPELCQLCEENPDRVAEKRLRKETAQKLDSYLDEDGERPYDDMVDEDGNVRDEAEYLRSLLLVNAQPANLAGLDILELLTERHVIVDKVEILTDASVYKTLHGGSGDNDNRLTHIMKHFPKQNPQKVLNDLQGIANKNDPADVVEFKDTTNGRYIKYDVSSGTAVVMDAYNAPPPEFMVVTAYEPYLHQVAKKVTDGTWEAI